MTKQRNYIGFDAGSGYPAGPKISYQCGICNDIVPSMPLHAAACKCRNIVVDVDAGRVAVKDGGKLKAFIVE